MKVQVIGITGGIASGKSTICQWFAEQGIPVVNADNIGRDIQQPGHPCMDAIRHFFGDDFFLSDGTLNRHALGNYVFGNEQALSRLNAIMKPFLLETIQKKLNEAKALAEQGKTPYPFVILECALLREDEDYRQLVDRVWLISADEKIRLQRLIQRNGLHPKEAQQRINAQLSAKEDVNRYDFVLDNSEDWDKVEKKLKKVIDLSSPSLIKLLR